jgi:hypothetical protein
VEKYVPYRDEEAFIREFVRTPFSLSFFPLMIAVFMLRFRPPMTGSTDVEAFVFYSCLGLWVGCKHGAGRCGSTGK